MRRVGAVVAGVALAVAGVLTGAHSAVAAPSDLTLTAAPSLVGVGGSAGVVDLAYAGTLPGAAALELTLVTDAPAVAGAPVLGRDDVALTADGAAIALTASPDGRTFTPAAALGRPARLALTVTAAGGTAASDLSGTTLVLTLRVVDAGTELDVEQRVIELVVPALTVAAAAPVAGGAPADALVTLTAPPGVTWTGLPLALALSADGLTPAHVAVEQESGAWRPLTGASPVAGTVVVPAGPVDVPAGATTSLRLRLTAAAAAPVGALTVVAAAFLPGQDPVAGAEPLGTARVGTTVHAAGAVPTPGPTPADPDPGSGSGPGGSDGSGTSAAASREGWLASTGADLAAGVLGAGLLAAGTLLLVAGRRRRTAAGGAA